MRGPVQVRMSHTAVPCRVRIEVEDSDSGPLPTSRAHYAVQRSHFPVDTDGHNTHRAVRAPVVSQRTPSPARHGLAGSASLRCLPSERKSLLRMRRKLTAIAAALTAFASMAAWGGATP